MKALLIGIFLGWTAIGFGGPIQNMHAAVARKAAGGGGGPSGETEFDIGGATYFAVAPAGYSYNGTQDANYSTRKYNSLSAAEAGLSTSPSTPQVINIIGDWSATSDTTTVNFDGVATSAGNYTLVRTIGTARHAGVFSSTYYKIGNNASTTTVVQLTDPHITVRGIQIEFSYTGGSGVGVQFSSGSETTCIVEECLVIRTNAGGSSDIGASNSSSSVTGTVRNCLIHNFDYGVLCSAGAGGRINADNVTVTNSPIYSFWCSTADTLRIRNCISYGATTGAASGTFAAGTNYNSTDESSWGYTVTGSGNANDRTSQTFTFVSGSDFHLQSGDGGAKNFGQDLSGTFTRDVDYQTRSGSWDIGFDEQQ